MFKVSRDEKFLNLENTFGHYSLPKVEQYGKVIAEYIWIDGTGSALRSKSRVLDHEINKLGEIPNWNYDGSSCMQADSKNSEVTLKPVSFYPDPFRGGDNILVFCDCYIYNKEGTLLVPANTNFRHYAHDVSESLETDEPIIKMLQSFALFEKMTPFCSQQLGWPLNGFYEPKKQYYCGVGTGKAFGRDLMERFLTYCLHSKINISSMNPGKVPGEWSFEIGYCKSLEIGDQLWTSRYILARTCEEFGIGLKYDSKPIECSLKETAGYQYAAISTISAPDHGETKTEKVGELIQELALVDSENLSTEEDEPESTPTNSTENIVFSGSAKAPSSLKSAPAFCVDPYVICSLTCAKNLLHDKECLDKLNQHYFEWGQSMASL